LFTAVAAADDASANLSLIDDLFTVQMITGVFCMSCKLFKIDTDHFYGIMLPIISNANQPVSLE